MLSLTASTSAYTKSKPWLHRLCGVGLALLLLLPSAIGQPSQNRATGGVRLRAVESAGRTTQTATSASATRVFFDGSEANNTNLWEQDGNRDRCTSVTVASDGVTGPFAGSRMIRCNSNGTVLWNASNSFETLVIETFPYTHEFLLRVRVRVDQNHARTDGSPKKLMRWFTGSVDYFNSIFSDVSGLKNEGPITSGSYWGDAPGDNTALSSKWGTVEVYYNAATRRLKHWHDDVLIRDETTGVLGAWYPFYLTSNFSDAHDAVNHVYFDDIEIYSDAASGTPATSGSMANGDVTVGGVVNLPVKVYLPLVRR